MTVRMLRSTILSEMNKDYVRTAISRGNDWNMVLRRHVLKNSLVPVVTFLAQTMAEIVAGSIVVEQVFAVPGLGRLLLCQALVSLVCYAGLNTLWAYLMGYARTSQYIVTRLTVNAIANPVYLLVLYLLSRYRTEQERAVK